MIRLTLLLIAGLYLTMLVGGGQEGDVRLGLRDSRTPEPEAVARAAATPTLSVETLATAEPEPPATVETPEPAPLPVVAVVPDPAPAAAPQVTIPSPLAAAPAAEPEPTVLYVTAARVNVREGPSTDYSVVGKVLRGDAVLIADTQDDWSLVRIEGDGIEGWVASRFLAEN